MKSNLPAKFLITVCVCVLMVLTFSACKDREVYANKSDFESYPEYWNSFNEDTTGDIFVPDDNKSNTASTSSGNSSSTDNTNNADTPDDDGGDYTANFEGGNTDNNSELTSGSQSSDTDSDNTNSNPNGSDSDSNGDRNGPIVIFK